MDNKQPENTPQGTAPTTNERPNVTFQTNPVQISNKMLTTPVRYGTNTGRQISDYSSGVQPGANSGIGHRLRAGNNAKMIHKTMGV